LQRLQLALWLAASPFVASAAHAQTQPSTSAPAQPTARAGFQLRVEGVAAKTEANNQATEQQNLIVKTARMAVSGEFNERYSYLVRVDVKNALFGADSVGQDGSVGALERAYVEDRVFDWMTLRLGRQPIADGSIEADYSSVDQYYISRYLEVVAYQVGLLNAGADVDFKLGAHTLQLQVFNGIQEEKSANAGQPHGGDKTWAVSYRSSLFGNTVKPIFSYDRFNRVRAGKGADRDGAAAYTAAAGGAQVSLLHFDWDAEYDVFRKPSFVSHKWDPTNVATEVQNPDQRITTVVTQLAYNATALSLRPFAKWSRDRQVTGGELDLEAFRYAAGLEYRPLKGFRYHAVVVNKHDVEPVKGLTTNTRQYIIGTAAKI
jgi:hypothetical protein